jgi:hypothetical protein
VPAVQLVWAGNEETASKGRKQRARRGVFIKAGGSLDRNDGKKARNTAFHVPSINHAI